MLVPTPYPNPDPIGRLRRWWRAWQPRSTGPWRCTWRAVAGATRATSGRAGPRRSCCAATRRPGLQGQACIRVETAQAALDMASLVCRGRHALE